jgi:hypothetical protein
MGRSFAYHHCALPKGNNRQNLALALPTPGFEVAHSQNSVLWPKRKETQRSED